MLEGLGFIHQICMTYFNRLIQTCHYQSGGTACRDATGLCDLPEYCTGNSEFCPEDVHKLNGVKCETKTGQVLYCLVE
jgi:hypothetical protein